MSDDNHRDNDLDEMLAALRSKEPNQLQVKRWQTAVQKNLKYFIRSRRRGGFWIPLTQLLAASVVGFVVGAAIFTQPMEQKSEEIAKSEPASATIEHVYINY